MPVTYQSSEIIKIPEVGPIRIDPQVKLLSNPNFDNMLEKAPKEKIPDVSTGPICCWKEIRKQCSKTFGFSKSPKNCWTTLSIIVNKKEAQLQEQIKSKKHSETLTSVNNKGFLPTKTLENLKKGKYAIRKARRKRSNGSRSSVAKSLNVRIAKSTVIERLLKERRLSLSKINSTINITKNNTKNNPLLRKRQKSFEPFIIEHTEQFTDKIDRINPLLLLNKYNFSNIDCEIEYKKANIVFPVDKNGHLPRKVLINSQFFLAVTKGYVILVKSSILYSI